MHADHHTADADVWTIASLEVAGRPARAVKAALKASDTVLDRSLAANATVARLPNGNVALAAMWEPPGAPSAWAAFKDAIDGACHIAQITGLPEAGLTVAVTTDDPGKGVPRR